MVETMLEILVSKAEELLTQHYNTQLMLKTELKTKQQKF